jgi:SAM-dependent methyltransferase
MNCRITGKPATELFSLGELYISDFIKTEGDYRGVKKWDLTMMLSPETQCLQLKENADKHFMYGKYWYRSGTNSSMTNELQDIANSCMQLSKIKGSERRLFLDIASNDGTLLKFVNREKYWTVGIDPAEGSFQEEAKKNCNIAIQDFFSKAVYEKWQLEGAIQKASIVTCIAMFYDLEDPIAFLKDVYDVMEDDGLFVIQQSYMPLMIKQLAFDNICHEHVFYHSLYSMEYMLDKVGMKVVDVQLNDVNGGSFRTYIQKKIAAPDSFGSSPYRDVAKMRLEALREYEKTLKLGDKESYIPFWNAIQKLKENTFQFIKDAHSRGKSIWVYGASTKGNTLLQWFGLDESLIDGAAERSPYKYGLKTIGTNIPIHSEETMRQVNPDYLLVLPWHFINEFVEREKEYLAKGGKFIVPCPHFMII